MHYVRSKKSKDFLNFHFLYFFFKFLRITSTKHNSTWGNFFANWPRCKAKQIPQIHFLSRKGNSSLSGMPYEDHLSQSLSLSLSLSYSLPHYLTSVRRKKTIMCVCVCICWYRPALSLHTSIFWWESERGRGCWWRWQGGVKKGKVEKDKRRE